MSDTRTLHVRWLLQPGRPPRCNVSIHVQAGIIEDITEHADAAADVHWDGVLIPPLVNCHTHLEFSTLLQPLTPALPFPAWISSVIAHRQLRTLHATSGSSAESDEQHIRLGLQESQAGGVTGVGEITTQILSPELAQLFAEHSVISFLECIGLDSAGIATQLHRCKQHLKSQPANGRHGISPHAPYSVHPDLFAAMVGLAEEKSAPMAMHLAETLDEIELLHNGTGRMADFLKFRGLCPEHVFRGGRRILDYLRELSRLRSALVIHANYLDPEERLFLADHPNLTVVYCPRTHHFFGHASHPWRTLRAAGVRVVLGTDSRASNPDLSIWKEFQFIARRHPEVVLHDLLPLVTTDSAFALGLQPEHYQLEIGQPLNGVLLGSIDQPGTAVHDSSLPELMLHPSTQPCCLFKSGQLSTLD